MATQVKGPREGEGYLLGRADLGATAKPERVKEQGWSCDSGITQSCPVSPTGLKFRGTIFPVLSLILYDNHAEVLQKRSIPAKLFHAEWMQQPQGQRGWVLLQQELLWLGH